MSFREKSAWISFICVLIFGGLYGWHYIRVEYFHAPENPVKYVFTAIAAIVALEVALHVAIAMQSPGEARTPKDERERLIDLRASPSTCCSSARWRHSASGCICPARTGS